MNNKPSNAEVAWGVLGALVLWAAFLLLGSWLIQTGWNEGANAFFQGTRHVSYDDALSMSVALWGAGFAARLIGK